MSLGPNGVRGCGGRRSLSLDGRADTGGGDIVGVVSIEPAALYWPARTL